MSSHWIHRELINNDSSQNKTETAKLGKQRKTIRHNGSSTSRGQLVGHKQQIDIKPFAKYRRWFYRHMCDDLLIWQWTDNCNEISDLYVILSTRNYCNFNKARRDLRRRTETFSYCKRRQSYLHTNTVISDAYCCQFHSVDRNEWKIWPSILQASLNIVDDQHEIYYSNTQSIKIYLVNTFDASTTYLWLKESCSCIACKLSFFYFQEYYLFNLLAFLKQLLILLVIVREFFSPKLTSSNYPVAHNMLSDELNS